MAAAQEELEERFLEPEIRDDVGEDLFEAR